MVQKVWKTLFCSQKDKKTLQHQKSININQFDRLRVNVRSFRMHQEGTEDGYFSLDESESDDDVTEFSSEGEKVDEKNDEGFSACEIDSLNCICNPRQVSITDLVFFITDQPYTIDYS